MSNHHSKSYHINIIYGDANLIDLFEDLAKETVKNSNDNLSNNQRVKKIHSNRRAY
jgi:hypothetical protein